MFAHSITAFFVLRALSRSKAAQSLGKMTYVGWKKATVVLAPPVGSGQAAGWAAAGRSRPRWFNVRFGFYL